MIFFHRFLIGIAVMFCGGLGWWLIANSRAGGGTGQMVLGIAFVVATVALAYYLKNLNRFLRQP